MTDYTEWLREKFPDKSDSWIKKALARVGDVREVAQRPAPLYVVQGRRELGDYRPMYQVWWSEREGRWLCTCYYSRFGYARQKRVCTHVAAVLVYREMRRRAERAESKPVYVAEGEVECLEEPRGGPGVIELKVKLAEEARGLLKFAKSPKRWRVIAVSRREEAVIICAGHEVARLWGEEMPYKAAKMRLEAWR